MSKSAKRSFASKSQICRVVDAKLRSVLLASLHLGIFSEIICQHFKEYQELYPAALLSELACMSPFSNMNAGARVILQCQMAKQTFGWPSYTLNHRSDNKMYRILMPQEPLVRSHLHDSWGMDDYPLGENFIHKKLRTVISTAIN
jgi:DNA-directed RNA polymerase I subunit RPA2